MSLEATVADPLREPAPAGWDDFAAGQGLSAAWHSQLLRAADWCAQLTSSMVLVREPTSQLPVAAFHVRHIGLTRPGRFAAPGRAPVLALAECRSVPLLGSGVAFARELDARDRAEAVRVFERALRRRVGLGGRTIGYRHLTDQQVSAFPSQGRVRMRLSPHQVLDLAWPDLPGYLASLSRRWRQQVERFHRQIERDESIQVQLSDQVDPAEAGWLAATVRHRHAGRVLPRPVLPASYFHWLNQLPAARYLTYRDPAGRVLLFVVMYDTGEELVAGIMGRREVADGGRRNLYFDLHLRQVEWLIASGRPRLVLGAGMAEIKKRFGSRDDPRWGVLALR